jgi:hypothetical protein
VLCGSGTAGAYQAGALRAIAESGIKVDIVAAHGSGVLTALAVAVDGGPRVWDAGGPWTDPRLGTAYRWRAALRFGFFGLLACLLLLLTPLFVLVLAAVVYAVATVMALVGATGISGSLVLWYADAVRWLFDPAMMPTVVPRLLVLAVLVILGVLAVSAVGAMRSERSKRRVLGAFWWRLLSSPLDATEPSRTGLALLWHLVHGASSEPAPDAAEVGRRYVDVVADNFGQPGFHEVILAVHDLDAQRDLVGSILAPASRAALESRQAGVGDRAGELVDFTGPQRETVAGFLAGALRLPVATAPATIRFPADSYWRGERHRVCDRPELASRLVDELAGIGVEQIILISPAPPPSIPHNLRPAPIDLRARMGEMVRSIEAAALTDATAAAVARCPSVFVIRPEHNPVGPFDFTGVYDETSDRQRTVAELIQQGHADAYHHLIEPMALAGELADPPD